MPPDKMARTKNHKAMRVFRPAHFNMREHPQTESILIVCATAVPMLAFTPTFLKIVDE